MTDGGELEVAQLLSRGGPCTCNVERSLQMHKKTWSKKMMLEGRDQISSNPACNLVESVQIMDGDLFAGMSLQPGVDVVQPAPMSLPQNQDCVLGLVAKAKARSQS